MKLDCVLTSCNLNKLYLDFIPMFVESWKCVNNELDIKILLIADKIPDKYKKYEKYIVLFDKIEGVSSVFISQYIRLLYPALLNYKNSVLITDMDMIPMNRKYYVDNIKEINDDKWVYYRDKLMDDWNQMAMCYNAASPSTWSEVFKIKTLDDVKKKLKDVFTSIKYTGDHGGEGWCTDQYDLYKTILNWEHLSSRFVVLKDEETKYKRLDRNSLKEITDIVKSNIMNGKYTDYHCLRPYDKYKDINDEVLYLLKKGISNKKKSVIDKVYIINLKSREDRKKHMLNQLKINNIDNYEFFEAIKPEEKDIDEWNKLFCKKIDNVKTKEMAIKYKIGCLGCLKSHLGVIKDALKRGFETILILEDDTIFSPNYKYLPYYMRLLNNYSMLYLTGSHLGKQLKINNNIMRVEGTYTTGSYIIKKDAMEYFVNNIEGYTKEVDVFYAEEIQTRFNSYCTIPHLAKQMDGYSDIQCKKVLHHDFLKN